MYKLWKKYEKIKIAEEVTDVRRNWKRKLAHPLLPQMTEELTLKCVQRFRFPDITGSEFYIVVHV